jgi:hypothetical protein
MSRVQRREPRALVGTSSDELPLRGSFEIEGSTVVVTGRTRYFTETASD